MIGGSEGQGKEDESRELEKLPTTVEKFEIATPVTESYSSWFRRTVPLQDGELKVGIVSNGIPVWLTLTSNFLSNCTLDWLLLPKNQSHWENLVGSHTEVYWMPPLEDSSTSEAGNNFDWNLYPRSHVVVFEGPFRPPRSDPLFWHEDLQVVLSHRSPRGKPPQGWKVSSRVLDHKELGGVTDWKGRVHAWTRIDSKDLTTGEFWIDDLLQGADSSFHDLVDKTKTGKCSRCAHEEARAEEQQQVSWNEVRMKRRKLWTLPTVYGSRAFTYRSLTVSEVVSCLDIPATLSKGWNESTKEVMVRELTAPIKAAASIGTCLAEWTKTTHKRKAEAIQAEEPPGTRKSCRTDTETAEKEREDHGNSGLKRMKGYERNKQSAVDTNTEKAVKHDKAAVPVELWDDRVRFLLKCEQLEDSHRRAFALMRTVMLTRWKRNVRRSWFDWWVKYESVIKINEPRWWRLVYDRGIQACQQAMKATFWGWPMGSGVFFWRWPEEYMRDLAIGVPPL